MREARCPRCGWIFSLYEGDQAGDLCCHCKIEAQYEAKYGPDWRARAAREINSAQEEKPL